MTSTSPGGLWASPLLAADILVVDDLEASRYLTASWLRRKGHRVTEAASGGAALAMVASSPVDLVVLDVNLPDMTGFEVCEQIKGDPRTGAIPVIHVSATAVEVGDRTLGLARGADAYLTEPVDPGELVATVEAALRYYRARRTAERLAARLTRLTEATLAINTATTFDELLAAVATGAAAVLDSSATALTLTPEGRLRVATTGRRGLAPFVRTEPPATLEKLTSVVLGAGRTAATAVLDDLRWHSDGSSFVVAARTNRSRPSLCIAIDAEAVSADDDRGLLLQLGQAAALACEGLRVYAEEHTMALTLQRSLLPGRLPDCPGLAMAVRYVPASSTAEIGGDFYEVTELDGRLLVAVGDVTGHSLEAATIMGEVRHALRAYAVEGHDLVGILDRLDVMLRRFHPLGLTTLCLLLVDLEAGTAQVANAGHIPPLIADATGNRYLDVGGPLLGIGLPRPPALEFPVPEGTLVLLVTDGLVERRGQVLDDGMDLLKASVSHRDDLEELCDDLVREFGQDRQDDIALLVFRVGDASFTGSGTTARHTTIRGRSPVDSLSRLGIVARKADLHGLRGDLGDWARTAGLTEEQTEDLTLACYEVLTNVAEHAYPQDPDGTFDLEAVATEAQLDVTVRDRGTWRTPTQDGSPSSLRGRGLLLARAVADQVRVDTGPGGTTVGLRWVLPVGRSARS